MAFMFLDYNELLEPLVDMSLLKIVPISIFTATEDETCTFDVAMDHIP